jgi:light-regulated signal transduction histidine kinase (bacteriophytochrome)
LSIEFTFFIHNYIFGIFQRLHTSKEHEGTGIGLAVVKEATLQLGGAGGTRSG